MYQLLCHCLCLDHLSIFIVIFLVCVYVVYVVYCLCCKLFFRLFTFWLGHRRPAVMACWLSGSLQEIVLFWLFCICFVFYCWKIKKCCLFWCLLWFIRGRPRSLRNGAHIPTFLEWLQLLNSSWPVVLGCLGGAAVGHRTSDLAVMGSIPGPGVVRHLGQLSLPSFRGR